MDLSCSAALYFPAIQTLDHLQHHSYTSSIVGLVRGLSPNIYRISFGLPTAFAHKMSTTTASAPSAASTAPSTITTVLSADEIGSVQNTIRGVIIATWILAVLAVSFRLFARRLSGAGFWWDDWLMVPALVRSLLVLNYETNFAKYPS